MTLLRQQERRNKAESEKRLAESAESQYPRLASTNWLRIISGEQAHLVLFASRDWEVLSRDRSIPIGEEWLQLFGFHQPPPGKAGSVAEGLVVGYEVTGNRQAMLQASLQLLQEVQAYVPRSAIQPGVTSRSARNQSPENPHPSLGSPYFRLL